MNRTEAIQWMLDDPEYRNIRMIRDCTGKILDTPKTYRISDYIIKETSDYLIKDTYDSCSLRLTVENDKSWFEKVPLIKQMSFTDAFYLYQTKLSLTQEFLPG